MPTPPKRAAAVEPEKLGAGRELWDETLEEFPDLNIRQRVLLFEACRAKDKIELLETRQTPDEDPPAAIAKWGEHVAKMLASMQLGKANARAGVPGVRAPYDGRRAGKSSGRQTAKELRDKLRAS